MIVYSRINEFIWETAIIIPIKVELSRRKVFQGLQEYSLAGYCLLLGMPWLYRRVGVRVADAIISTLTGNQPNMVASLG